MPFAVSKLQGRRGGEKSMHLVAEVVLTRHLSKISIVVTIFVFFGSRTARALLAKPYGNTRSNHVKQADTYNIVPLQADCFVLLSTSRFSEQSLTRRYTVLIA